MRRYWAAWEDYGDLSHPENWNRLVEDLVTASWFDEAGLDAEAFRAQARAEPATYAALLQLLFRQYAEDAKVRVVGEKTPNHVLHMPRLQAMVPEARFIHVVRDPRAVVNSWRSVPWSSGRLWRDAEVWRDYVQAARQDADQLEGALHTLYYEQLVRAPEAVLRAVCRFLEMPYRDKMLAFHEEAPDTVNVEREPWKEAATRPIDPAAADRWQQELSARMVALIEAKAWPEMERWGYLRETPWERLAPAFLSATIRKAGWKMQLLLDRMREE